MCRVVNRTSCSATHNLLTANVVINLLHRKTGISGSDVSLSWPRSTSLTINGNALGDKNSWARRC
ncbi:protein of unknown function [Georgfuchsia toluolica]|uniref:Uncharacterized protein n=1 Tax=Georgfuchsia toluolica TaxID=424218 RepID=A0A916N8S3_9PROT|nr:protein of unknown function [Georgfuchsia toluolica]